MRVSRMLIVSAFVLLAAGCARKGSQADRNAAGDSLGNAPAAADTTPVASNEGSGTPAANDRPSGAPDRSDRAGDRGDGGRVENVPPPPVERTVVVPAGTAIPARLEQRLSTKDDTEGGSFTATTLEAVTVEGKNVMPAGSTVRGNLYNLKRAPNVGGSAKMTLRFTEIVTPAGTSYPITANDLYLEGKSTTKGDVEKVLGGAVGGAVLGGILGGKKGAGRGAAVGGATGAVIAVATKGHDIVLEPGTKVEVSLSQQVPVTLAGGVVAS